jgi:hypothetical protein
LISATTLRFVGSIGSSSSVGLKEVRNAFGTKKRRKSPTASGEPQSAHSIGASANRSTTVVPSQAAQRTMRHPGDWQGAGRVENYFYASKRPVRGDSFAMRLILRQNGTSTSPTISISSLGRRLGGLSTSHLLQCPLFDCEGISKLRHRAARFRFRHLLHSPVASPCVCRERLVRCDPSVEQFRARQTVSRSALRQILAGGQHRASGRRNFSIRLKASA